MSRDLNQLAKLNTLEDNNESEVKSEAELQMFADTNFFDLDIGRSTDIATTVDELLMQQEKHIQYPQKQQPIYDDSIAGPSYNPQQQQQSFPQTSNANNIGFASQQQIPFDFTPFSLAEELPPASLSILEIDPVFQAPQQSTAHQNVQHHTAHMSAFDMPHRTTRHPPMQRHELAEILAPTIPPTNVAPTAPPPAPASVEPAEHRSRSSSVEESPAPNSKDEKRRRNTAASARFRIKKKLREQEMEKNLKLMQQKISEQDERIKQLEMENTWLKNLVVERNTERDTSSLGKLREAFFEKKI